MFSLLRIRALAAVTLLLSPLHAQMTQGCQPWGPEKTTLTYSTRYEPPEGQIGEESYTFTCPDGSQITKTIAHQDEIRTITYKRVQELVTPSGQPCGKLVSFTYLDRVISQTTWFGGETCPGASCCQLKSITDTYTMERLLPDLVEGPWQITITCPNEEPGVASLLKTTRRHYMAGNRTETYVATGSCQQGETCPDVSYPLPDGAEFTGASETTAMVECPSDSGGGMPTDASAAFGLTGSYPPAPKTSTIEFFVPLVGPSPDLAELMGSRGWGEESAPHELASDLLGD